MVDHAEGLICAPLTAMNDDGTVNLDIIEEYVNFLVRNDVKGAFVNGTTGVGMLLSLEERLKTAEKWVEVAPKDFRVIIHTGHTSLIDAQTMVKQAADIGAYGVGSIGQVFFRPGSVEQLVDYLAQEASAASGLPYYYYHIPRMSGVDFDMAELCRLADEKIPNFAGIKHSKRDNYGFRLCRDYKYNKFDIMWGSDENLLTALVVGARSAVGSTYNWAAPLYNDIFKAYYAGDIAKADELQLKSMKMIRAEVATGSFMGSGKTIMKWLGLDLGPTHAPIPNLTPEKEAILRKELESIGFFDFCCK